MRIDWSFDEDRSRIRTGYGPENTTRLRRFAIQLIKARGLNVAETLRRLNRNVRCVFDFLKMTANTQPRPPPLNPSLPSTGRPNQTAGSSPGPVPPELSPTPTDNPNPPVHPGINTRGPSTNLPCPIRHAHKRRNPSIMPTNPTHELICPALRAPVAPRARRRMGAAPPAARSGGSHVSSGLAMR